MPGAGGVVAPGAGGVVEPGVVPVVVDGAVGEKDPLAGGMVGVPGAIGVGEVGDSVDGGETEPGLAGVMMPGVAPGVAPGESGGVEPGAGGVTVLSVPVAGVVPVVPAAPGVAVVPGEVAVPGAVVAADASEGGATESLAGLTRPPGRLRRGARQRRNTPSQAQNSSIPAPTANSAGGAKPWRAPTTTPAASQPSR